MKLCLSLFRSSLPLQSLNFADSQDLPSAGNTGDDGENLRETKRENYGTPKATGGERASGSESCGSVLKTFHPQLETPPDFHRMNHSDFISSYSSEPWKLLRQLACHIDSPTFL
ncbi:Hypothetical protein NTJ_03274 [Nesidiocoris tenuis]|uniref:Uncharacterized protein n=1 Tax=Nesidiocoris tenuis TaxID=355587 RepID=A0ABN7AGZ1_9HEMI|nr:Hypothetical protein NTJ_03274 [Nesidiocoris tenuis]